MIKNMKIPYRVCALALAAVLLALIVPLLAVARYDVPCADDFSFGARAHLAYESTHSPLAAVAAAVQEARTAYGTWQGSFSAIFLMAIPPMVFGEQAYALTAWIMLAALIGGTFIFCAALFRRVFGTRRSVGVCAAALVCIIATQTPISPVQGFYWYNGAVYYTFFYGLALAALALGIRLATDGGAWRIVLLTLLAVFIGGGNYVTALSTAIIGVSALALLALMRDKRAERLIVPVAALIAALAVSIAAPGNAVRQAQFADTPGALKAIFMSFGFAARCVVQWFRLPTVGMLALLAALLRRAAQTAKFEFRCPVLVTAWSYCLMSAMFCPPIYAMGDGGELRLYNIIYFAYLLLLALNLFYWMGWLARRRGWRTDRDADGAPLIPAAAGAVVMGLCCLAAMRMGQPYTSAGALSSLRSGEAAAYYACAEERYAILRDDTVRDAVLPAFPCYPDLLYYDDFMPNADDWRNGAGAHYYGKDSIRVG